MVGILEKIFGAGNFLPHEYCYLRNPAVIGLHFWSDLLIGIAYVAISGTLLHLVRHGRREIPFSWMFLAFGAFIVACGGTHFMEVWTLWVPRYWLAGLVKALTAAASVATALALPPLVPRTIDMVRAAKVSEKRKWELEHANAALEQEIAERRRAEAEVRKLATELEERVRQRTAELARANEGLAEKAAIVYHSRDAILSWSSSAEITSWNPAAEKLFGYRADEILGKHVSVLLPESERNNLSALLESIEKGAEVSPFEIFKMRKDGKLVQTHVTLSPLKDAEGNVRGASVIARDITESKRQEEQLRQVQRLESLGVIAGGVAHDFNNLLVGIMGNASMVLETIPRSSPNYSMIESAIKASEKAAHLTQQLLAYAGKGRFVSEKVDLSALVREIGSLLQTSIPRNVSLRLELDQNLPPVDADPGQLQQVIMNLVINGAEAIGEHNGTLLVTTSMHHIDEAYMGVNFAGEALKPGRYVVLEVHDSGSGMDEETKARIFDPFFTTKFTGRGLGLSAVMGIVRSHKGAIRVYTELGNGSSFRVLLPAASGSPSAPHWPDDDEELRGSGTVLVIDDEEVVRATAETALRRYGYSVLIAADGQSGVDLFRERAGEIRAVLLDMTMPVMSGTEAFRQIRHISPDTPVVVSSGYNEVEAIRRFTAKGIAAFVQKPYTAAKLARIIKHAIEARK